MQVYSRDLWVNQAVTYVFRDRHSRARRYESELQSCGLEVAPVEFSDYHPLKSITVSRAPYVVDAHHMWQRNGYLLYVGLISSHPHHHY